MQPRMLQRARPMPAQTAELTPRYGRDQGSAHVAGAPDGGAPGEGVEPDCGARRIVHPEVEQEPPHGGDDHERRHRKPLEPEGRHAAMK
jgi:hypothetical protein